jgi:pilus assembly protein CpaC
MIRLFRHAALGLFVAAVPAMALAAGAPVLATAPAPMTATPTTAAMIPERADVPVTSAHIKLIALASSPTHVNPASLRQDMPAVTSGLKVSVNKTADIELPVQVNDVVVGNSDIADVMVRSPTQIYVVGRAVGQTNVYLVDRGGKIVRRLDVEVSLDAVAIQTALQQVLPDEHNVHVEAVNDSLYLSGSVKTDQAANEVKALARRYVSQDANLVNLLKISNDQQVLLKVKVAEIQRSVLKELGVGVSTSAVKLFGNGANTTLTGSTSSTVGLIDAASSALYGSATIRGIGSLVSNLNLLENQGLIRTLVEPNLTAVSGETATMLAGGELPIPVSQVNGAITVDFKPYGVLLGFTPTVLDPGRLSLKMTTEVSAIDNNNRSAISSTISVPAFKVRRAGSTVELPSGGSIMIAGLLQNDITSDVAGLPGAMDLPVLGALFRSNAFQRNETELVVILSAYVVQPVDTPDAMSTPSDGFAPTSDLNRFLFGRLQETYTTRGKDAPVTPEQLKGPIGYIVQ